MVITYEKAKPQILEGDFIGTLKAHGLFGKLTKLFTGKYTHCGVAAWIDGGLWMVEINGGKNHAIPLSQLADEPFDVFSPPIEDREAIRKASIESIRIKQSYGYWGTVLIGIIEFFKLNNIAKDKLPKLVVCSGYVVKIYNLAGWDYDNLIISPTKLSTMLNKKFEVRKQGE